MVVVMRYTRKSHSAEYWAWRDMLRRCESESCKSWKWYGARGIRVCERWHTFDVFMQDVGPKPSPLHSLDRINNDGNYEPENVRWATASEQALNRRLKESCKRGHPLVEGNLMGDRRRCRTCALESMRAYHHNVRAPNRKRAG